MIYSDFEQQFAQIFAQNGLQRFVQPDICKRFYELTNLFLEANSRFNLTAIREIPDVIAKHYADCLLAESYFPQNASVLDLGCGGGFPTFPLAIVRPDLRLIALDSTQKKIDFVAETAKTLGLNNIQAICARAEAVASGKLREGVAVVTSRAMARMNVLAELGLPCLALGGKMVVLKGAQGSEECQEALSAIQTLGGALKTDNLLLLQTPSGAESRHILVVEKQKATPKAYPRQYATIVKKPL